MRSAFGASSAEARWQQFAPGLERRSAAAHPNSAFLSYRIPDAVRLSAEEFESAVKKTYRLFLEDVAALPASIHPVRIWNSIPGLLEPLGCLEHRYMAFNRARHEALLEMAASLSEAPPTASGTGNTESSFYLFGLCRSSAGLPIENPRQVSAFQYSDRYGPSPPCFSRATRIVDDEGRTVLLIAGTASVLGEDSTHAGDWSRQLDETFRNLQALVTAGDPNRAAGDDLGAHDGKRGRNRWVGGAYSYLRVYYPQEHIGPRLARLIETKLGIAPELEPCALCRPDLLVEIEGAFVYS